MTRTMDDNTKSRKQLLAELATLRSEMESLQRVRDDLRAELSELRDKGEQREGAPSEPLLFPTSEDRAPAESAPDASLRSHQAERDQQLRDYRAILGTVVEGVISLDVTGKLVLSNAAARTMLHWRPFEFAEQLVHDRIHPRRADGNVCRAENCPILRALASEDAASGEDVYFRSDGSSFPVHFTSTPWRVREQHAGAVFIFQDVSRQVRVEAQLAAARESFRATFEQLAVGIAHVTMSGKIRRANQCLAEMLGYARHELIDLRASALAHPDDYAVAVDRVGRLLGGEGQSYSYETRMITKDGRTVWTNVTGSLVRAADGSPDYLLAVIERIDQRKELELRLVQREREATQQAAEVLATLDAIPHPVVVVDIHGQITRSNAVARDYMRHLGIKPEVRFLNDRMNDLLSITAADGRPLKLHDRPLWRVLAGEVLASANAVELVLRKRGGTELRMSVTGAPVRNDAGEIVEGVCVFRDITGEWLLERELAERASQLETAFEAMTDAVLVMDAEGNLVRANAAYRRLFASLDSSAEPPRELLARISRLALRNSLGRVIPREETPSMRVLTGEVLSGLNAVELGVIDENGRETLLIATGAPLHDLNGMITGGVCIYRDVSERRSDAAQSRDLFRDLLSIAVLVASSAGDADGRSQFVARLPLLVSDICDITRRKLGCLHVGLIAVDPLSGALSPVAASGMSPEYEREWRDEAERSSLPDYFGAAMRMRLHQGEVVVHDVRVTSPEQVHRRILAAPVRADGTLIGILGCEQVGSVREYTAGELELVTAAANVAALTLLAERSGPYRSSIVGDGLFTSHSDVAQLLSTLVTTFEQPIATLRRESIRSADDRLGRKRVRHVESALRSLEGELGVLREFAEIQGGTFRLRRGRVDLGALLWREVELQRRRHTLRQIVFDGPRSGMVIEGDARRLRWIFEVLLNGAISATPADMPVEVTLTADSHYACASVRDGGAPLTRADREQIATLHYQPTSASRGTRQGLGVALALCRRLVEAHGGQWEVESLDGRGATFCITLPLAEDEQP